MSTAHLLKCRQPHFQAVILGEKRFELRKHDRDFKVNDFIFLAEVDASDEFTGEVWLVVIEYILDKFEGLKNGYCILGIKCGYDRLEGYE